MAKFGKGSREWELMTDWWSWIQKYWNVESNEDSRAAITAGSEIRAKYKNTPLYRMACDLVMVGLSQIMRNQEEKRSA